MIYDFDEKNETYKKKMRSEDRILVVRVMEGKKPVSNIGLVDPRLFKGETNLHCYRGPFDNFWRFRLEAGRLPEPMQGTWTSFQTAHDYVKSYFAKRNLEIKEIVDDYQSRYA